MDLDRGARRPGRLPGELHGAEADPRGRGRIGAGSAAGHRGEVLPPALLGHDAQRPRGSICSANWRRDYRPECVVELVWQACLTYDVESHRVKRLAEDGIGLPVPADRDRLLALRFGAHRAARRGLVRNRPGPQDVRPVSPALPGSRSVVYSSPFVPPEWIAAHGWTPSRRDAGRRTRGRGGLSVRRRLRRLAGPDIRALVFATTCDPMRRAAEIGLDGQIPRFLFHVPATWQTPAAHGLYRAELKRLGRFLERLGGTDADVGRIGGTNGAIRSRARDSARPPRNPVVPRSRGCRRRVSTPPEQSSFRRSGVRPRPDGHPSDAVGLSPAGR